MYKMSIFSKESFEPPLGEVVLTLGGMISAANHTDVVRNLFHLHPTIHVVICIWCLVKA